MTDEQEPPSAGELLRGASGLAQVAWKTTWKAARRLVHNANATIGTQP